MKTILPFVVLLAVAGCDLRPPKVPPVDVIGRVINGIPPKFTGWKLTMRSGGGSDYGAASTFIMTLDGKSADEATKELREYFLGQLEKAGMTVTGKGESKTGTVTNSFSFRVTTPRSVGTVSVSMYPLDSHTIAVAVATAQVGVE